MNSIETLVEEFTSGLSALIERETLEHARQAVEAALGATRTGRPAKVSGITLGAKPRRKLPKQLCPVPDCTNLAAPVFGMVCAEHKNVAKAKIKKYREARRAAKLGTKSKSALPPKAKAKAKGKKRPTLGRKARKAIKAAAKPRANKPAPKKPIARRKPVKKVRPKAAPKAAEPAAAPPTLTAAA